MCRRCCVRWCIRAWQRTSVAQGSSQALTPLRTAGSRCCGSVVAPWRPGPVGPPARQHARPKPRDRDRGPGGNPRSRAAVLGLGDGSRVQARPRPDRWEVQGCQCSALSYLGPTLPCHLVTGAARAGLPVLCQAVWLEGCLALHLERLVGCLAGAGGLMGLEHR